MKPVHFVFQKRTAALHQRQHGRPGHWAGGWRRTTEQSLQPAKRHPEESTPRLWEYSWWLQIHSLPELALLLTKTVGAVKCPKQVLNCGSRKDLAQLAASTHISQLLKQLPGVFWAVLRIFRIFKFCHAPKTFLEILCSWKETVIWIYNWIKHQKQLPGIQHKLLRTKGSLLTDCKDSHKSEQRTARRDHKIVLVRWKTLRSLNCFCQLPLYWQSKGESYEASSKQNSREDARS